MSIQKTTNGTYIVRWRYEGIMASKTFQRKEDAVLFDSQIKLADVPVKKLERGQMSFSEFAREYLERYARVSKEASSSREDESVLRSHLIPEFGRYRIGMIDLRTVSEFRAKLLKSGLKRKTVNNIFSIMKRMFTLAVRWGYLSTNPILFLEPLKIQDAEMKFWSFEDAARFLKFAETHNREVYEIVAVAINTGLRYGEQRGLLRDALDFGRREILVKRSYCSRLNAIVPRTKGKKDRRVPMNQLVYEILRKRAMSTTEDEIFRYFDLSNFRERLFVPAMEKAQVPVIRYHDLRHTFASHLAMRGVPLLKIKELMGHADYKTTLRYTHLAPSQLDGITDVLLLAHQ